MQLVIGASSRYVGVEMEAVMKDKPPGPVSCPHCGNAEVERLPSIGDYSEYRCPTCRDYRISGTQEDKFDKGIEDPKEAWLFEDADGRRCLLGL